MNAGNPNIIDPFDVITYDLGSNSSFLGYRNIRCTCCNYSDRFTFFLSFFTGENNSCFFVKHGVFSYLFYGVVYFTVGSGRHHE